ncbi:Periplasmic [NiFeSe] hydrogenase large subunit [Maridesulfovibrio hydrothermalis AM13 = DSM 14728]|uniref:Periplasmic [NiFe] hydrogenase large subunit n=2 Tax=Maridesulfovibrio TaxID=2794998 RepID=L0RDV4_9BACT|nr:Periplasmic [NiFeSe] hydrogenase large subunit [Maridesulfovibrio hydrothermalis AM13 = DSM 14728]
MSSKSHAPASKDGKIKIAIDPVTRIEGHLKAEVVVKDGKVVDAWLSGGMYRGFENILVGRDPRDAAQLTQRLCGVCPTAHSTASCLALDDAFGAKITTNGRVTRNLIFGANYLQSHILHFYHLTALDFVRGPGKAPFVPRFEQPDLRLDEKTNAVAVDQYIKALEIRRICHEMVALFGGKMPHISGQVVGGTTEIPTKEKLAEYASRFKDVQKFIAEVYVPTVYLIGSVYKDLFKIGGGYKNCMAYGVFPMSDGGDDFLIKSGVYVDGKDEKFDPKLIKEFTKYSWYTDECSDLHPSEGKTIPDVHKKDAYSFCKASRYNGNAVEVGPLARMWIHNPELSPMGKKQLKDLYGITAKNFRDLGEDMAFSLMGRHVARAEESYLVANAIGDIWLGEVKEGEETYVKTTMPESGEGVGLTEAPRGSLLHYINIKDSKTANYQMIPATLWNSTPRDDKGMRGTIEEALVGCPVPDPSSPVDISRIIRSFDP